MRRWHRALLASLTALGLLVAAAPGSSAQDEPEPGAVVQPPVEEAGGRIDSWALAPSGSLDPEAAGNRPNLSYEVDPGATIEDSVTIYNFGNVQLTFAVYATDARNTASGEFDSLPGDVEPTGVGSWITVGQRNLTVAAGQQITMPITIEVPSDARPGDHVGTILAANAAEGIGPDGKTVVLDRRTGTRVYLRVKGAIEPELVIESVKGSYSPSLNPLSGTAEIQYRIRNRGNVRLGGRHRLTVSGPLGVGSEGVPAEELPELLPGEDATFTRTLEGVPATMLTFAEVTLEPTSGAGSRFEVDARRSLLLAPPVTVIVLLLAAWMSLRARRAYRRHRAATVPAGPSAPVRESELV